MELLNYLFLLFLANVSLWAVFARAPNMVDFFVNAALKKFRPEPYCLLKPVHKITHSVYEESPSH